MKHHAYWVVASLGVSAGCSGEGSLPPGSTTASQQANAAVNGVDPELFGALQQLVKADSRPSLAQARTQVVEELHKRYAGTISGQTEIGSKEATEHSRRMSELMRLWNPIGFSVRDVQSVLGSPTHQWKRGERESFTAYAGFQYDFDFGEAGSHWQLTVEGETVEPGSSVAGIRHIPGE